MIGVGFILSIIRFVKMHGCGNDFIVIDCINNILDNPEQVCAKFADRHFGIGFDGLILLERSDSADVKMRIFNADASEAMMCGNGIRCVGKYVYDHSICKKDNFVVETLSGLKKLQVFDNQDNLKVKVNMGNPVILQKDRSLLNGKFFGTFVSMGNPHCVIFQKEINNLDVDVLGPLIEKSANIIDGVNVEFVEVMNRKNLQVRVWERGSKETLSCGTGASAAVVASYVKRFVDKDEFIDVKLAGGLLQVKYVDDEVYLIGDAVEVFEGQFSL